MSGPREPGGFAAARRLSLVLLASPLLAVLHLAVLLLAAGCTRDPDAIEPSAGSRPPGWGVVVGALAVQGWRRAITEGSPVLVELRHQRTRQTFVARPGDGGEFVLPLPPGAYVVSMVWSGLQRVSGERLRFTVVPDRSIYLGTLAMELPTGDRRGSVAVIDRYDETRRRLAEGAADGAEAARLVRGLLYVAPRQGAVVSALLDGRVLAPFVVDAHAAVTTLTRKVAQDVGLGPLERLPTRTFQGPDGAVELPVGRLRTLRIGEAQAADVEVAVDTTERLPLSVLGASLLPHAGAPEARQPAAPAREPEDFRGGREEPRER